MKLFRTPEALMKPLFGMTTGDIFSTDKLRKGIENMRKLYGKFGYIDFVPEPDFHPAEDGSDQIDLTLTADEGKQFFIRRIDFSGNTTTRDKVIRREILLDEGDMFNTELVGLQHPAPEPARLFRNAEEGRSRRHQAQSAVQHRGHHAQGEGARQELGRPERRRQRHRRQLRRASTTPPTTSSGWARRCRVESQLGTRMRDVSLGFTEPYFLDRPLQLGFVVYLRRFNFDQGREASILSGTNLIPLYNQLGSQNLLNYIAEQPRVLGFGELPASSAVSPASASPTGSTFPTS